MIAVAAGLLCAGANAQIGNDDGSSGSDNSATSNIGPVRLMPSQNTGNGRSRIAVDTGTSSTTISTSNAPRVQRPYEPGDFETYVNRLQGVDVNAYATALRAASPDQPVAEPPRLVRRLGAELILDTGTDGGEGPRAIGEDYVIGIGDEIQLTLWGSVDGDMRLVVDRVGRINVPRVGPILVAGVRYGELNNAVRARVAQVFKNFQVTTVLGRLRSFRIYVTGFTQRPGPYRVSSLATIVNGLMQAGGPSAAGSFRNIELRRSGKVLSHFDIYDLMLRGDKSADVQLQAEDVLYIGPIGPQAAILGSVNRNTIIEMKSGENLADVLRMAGGFSAVADRSRLSVERLSDRNDRRVVQLALPDEMQTPVGDGDVFTAFSAVDAVLAQDKQYRRVRVEGEVRHPGDYLLPPDSTLQDAIGAAGGMTPTAYLYGTTFTRESVRKAQRENYDRALRDLQTESVRRVASQGVASSSEASAIQLQQQNNNRLIEQLRTLEPTGRIVLQLSPDTHSLPKLLVQDGDRLTIPSRPSSVGVFGSVFNTGSYLYTDNTTVSTFLRQAGGTTRGADTGSAFVIRANGSVVSARQRSSGWISMGNGLDNLPAEPGDTIFVPEEMDFSTFMQSAKDWTQILYQFGLGAAALKTIKN